MADFCACLLQQFLLRFIQASVFFHGFQLVLNHRQKVLFRNGEGLAINAQVFGVNRN